MQCYACGDDDVVATIRPYNKAFGAEFPMCASCLDVFELALEISSTGWDRIPNRSDDDEGDDDELFPCHNCERMCREGELFFHPRSDDDYELGRFCLTCFCEL